MKKIDFIFLLHLYFVKILCILSLNKYICMCVCVHTHTHTHTQGLTYGTHFRSE